MSGNKVTKSSLSKRIRDLVAGTQKHTPNGSLTLGNVTYAAPALVQLLQGLADALDATDAARARWQDALKNATDARAKVGPLVADYQAWVSVTYAGAPSTLADYGVTPRKVRTPLTVDQQAAAVAKRTATRAARHTMGKVQKLKVKGNVVGIFVTPVKAEPVVAKTTATPTAGYFTVTFCAPSPSRPRRATAWPTAGGRVRS
jgi:hypothetical protein